MNEEDFKAELVKFRAHILQKDASQWNHIEQYILQELFRAVSSVLKGLPDHTGRAIQAEIFEGTVRGLQQHF